MGVQPAHRSFVGRPKKKMRLRADEWNRTMARLCTRYPVSFQMTEAPVPEHAWMVTPIFEETDKRWTAQIRPGLVNGRLPTIAVTYAKISEAAKNYLTIKDPTKTYLGTDMVQLPLNFNPAVPLVWREIGGTADPISVSGTGGNIRQTFEAVLPIFVNQGVQAPGQVQNAAIGQRRLFACDIILSQPRPFLVNEISSLPGGLLGGSIFSVDAKATVPKDIQQPPKILAIPRYTVPAVSNSFGDIFFQRFLDEPKDEVHLSTVYALSPPLDGGASFPTYVDETFTLDTRYFCHYNLAHALQRVVPRTISPPLTLVTGLGFGLGDTLFNLILASHNDLVQSTLDLFNQRSLRGMFWNI